MRAVLLLAALIQTTASAGSPQTPAAEDVTIPPKVLTRIVPAYFAAALRGLLKGPATTFSIDIGVNVQGRVSEEKVLQPSGVPALIETDTVAALRRWTFEPARRGGVPVPSAVHVTVRFVQEPSQGGGSPDPVSLVPHLSIEGADDDFGKGAAAEDEPGVTSPRRTKYVEPQYPPSARGRGAQGAVLLDVLVQADGTVGAVRVALPADPALDAEAMRVVRLWKYAPPLKNGQPVAIVMRAQVIFSIR